MNLKDVIKKTSNNKQKFSVSQLGRSLISLSFLISTGITVMLCYVMQPLLERQSTHMKLLHKLCATPEMWSS